MYCCSALYNSIAFTIISEMDALKNGIDFEDNVKTVGGSVSSYPLSSCKIIFQTDTGEAYIEDLPFIKIIDNEN